MADNQVLSESEIKEKLDELAIWGIEKIDQARLVCKVEFDDYKDATFFANGVFSLAEQAFHHPEVKVEYGAVSIDLYTHDAEGLTEKDFELAEKIEEKVRETDW
jgi:pterin-4a-carbinolamine dehydratase